MMGSGAELEGFGEKGSTNHIIGLTRYRDIVPSGAQCGKLRQGSSLEEKGINECILYLWPAVC
jgi:hypothetical protein